MDIPCIRNVYSMCVQYIFKVTKYDLADARCTRCRSLPAVQPVQVYVGICKCISVYVGISTYVCICKNM